MSRDGHITYQETMRLLDDVREIAREQVEYRELLLKLTRRDLLLRYKQTLMGFGWAVSMPLLNMIIFSVVFTRVVRLDTEVPYPLFAYAGLLPWSFFASSLRFAVESLTRHASLLTKVYFPREVLPFSAIVVALVDFGVGALVLVGLMLYYGVGVTWSVLALPVVVLVQVIFTARPHLALGPCCERPSHAISGRTRASLLNGLLSPPASLGPPFGPIWRTLDALATWTW